MTLKRCLWALLISVFVVAVLGSVEWSPAGASRLGQTVPTRTPTAAPATPTPLPAPTEPPAPATEDPAATPVPTPALLPVAGGLNSTVWNLLIVSGLVLITLGTGVWLARRRV
jgi:hypothetical protein